MSRPHAIISARVVRETAARGGRVLIPAFAVGRTQELVYDLQVLTREKAIPPIPVIIDSPLATAATAVFERNTDVFDRTENPVREIEQLFRFEQLTYTQQHGRVQGAQHASRSHDPDRGIRDGRFATGQRSTKLPVSIALCASVMNFPPRLVRP